MARSTTTLRLVLVLVIAAIATAFVPPFQTHGKPSAVTVPSSSIPTGCSSTTRLAERKWNFNEGQAPWGLKANAEIWNGRVAQMAFVWVFLQELVTGKGIFKGLDEGDAFFVANAVAFAVSVVGLTGWLALKGTDDYTKDA
ncbi:chlorophyll A-B binding protein [Nitzschia inconspicua]|uniref:Chlorophyll A-B binding protein n=1 Tax=Nitzschia inconspicua TaxID=303405 RepID=A0A9K3LT73_9STRA|nr:chlorophyll A-B binding protein [Nitzschia inconspicua]